MSQTKNPLPSAGQRVQSHSYVGRERQHTRRWLQTREWGHQRQSCDVGAVVNVIAPISIRNEPIAINRPI